MQENFIPYNVESHSAWADHSLGICHVESRHVANGETVPRVDVRKADGLANDAWEGGHIGDLPEANFEFLDTFSRRRTSCLRAFDVRK